MNLLSTYAIPIINGMSVTFLSFIITGLISLFIGIILGTISSNYIKNNYLKALIKLYVFIAKGIPAYVQILIAYFILPLVFSIELPSFMAACGALAFSSSGYTTEIIRSGINAVPRGQWDACNTLGYSFLAMIKRIILPQAFKNITPALFGEFEQLLKSTSLFATIGITELTRTGQNIISRDLNPIPVYLGIAIIYLLFSLIFQVLLLYIEKGFKYA